MSPLASATRRVTADLGGTHTRLAIHDAARNEFRHQQVFLNREFPDFEAVLQHWLQGIDEPAPDTACFAVAALIRGDRVCMTNRDWSFSCRALASRFGFRALAVLNDFEAHAYALPWLAASEVISLQAGTAQAAQGRLAVLGPGTGLGGALLEGRGATAQAIACEPGHMNLAPGTPELLALWPQLVARYGRVYVELLLSGSGLARLHEARGHHGSGQALALEPAEITRRALSGEDAECARTVACFCALLGDVCADFILATGAWGGLYLAGGILPRITPLLQESPFLERLRDRGPLADALEAVPVRLIQHPSPGLLGAAHAPLGGAPPKP